MAHSLNPGFRPGDHWTTCDRCGEDYRKSQVKKEWTGLVVCRECWEPRHPQDFVRARKDKIAVDGDLARSQLGDNFNFTPIEPAPDPDVCDTCAIANEAVAGKAITGKSTP